MHIAILFDMDTVKKSFGKPNLMWGRVVANHSFVQALAAIELGHRVTLFVPTRPDVDLLKESLLADFPNRISAVPFNSIPSFLKDDPIDVLHTLDPSMWRAGHIRNFMSDKPFAITGVTHSIANEHFLSWALLANANGIGEGDCLICTTPTAEKVIDSAISKLRETQPDFLAAQTAVIPLGLPLDTFRIEHAPPREKFGFLDDEFLILSLARFNPHFKLDYLPLLNLVSLLRERLRRPFRLILAGASGDGSYANLVKEFVEKFELQNWVSFILDPHDESKLALYRNADVFLTLSDNIQETFGLTVIEAMAAGLPIVASDWNGYKSLVEHGVTGFLVPTKALPANSAWEARLGFLPDGMMHLYCAQATAIDLPSTRDALLTIAEDKKLATSMGQAAFAKAEQYDWNAVVRQYLQLWQRLTDNLDMHSAAISSSAVRSSLLRVLGDFSSYPTTHLSDDDRFVTSSLGLLVLEGKRTLSAYGLLAEVMDLKILNDLLRLCTEAKCVAELSAATGSGLHADDPVIARSIMWLYKYGLVELAN